MSVNYAQRQEKKYPQCVESDYTAVRKMQPWPMFPVSFVTALAAAIGSSLMSTHQQHKRSDPIFGCCRQSQNKPFQNNHTPFPKHHTQQLPVYLKYLQYPQKPGKCLPHFPFDYSAIRGQVLTYTRHERCLPFTLALGKYSWLVLTIAVQLLTIFGTNSAIHPRQQQYTLSAVGKYPTSTYSYNLMQQ